MGSERRPHNPVTRSSSVIGKSTLIGVVHYPFVEKNRSSHFGFVSTSLRPLRTSVPLPVSKLTCRRCRSRQRTNEKAAEWNPPNRQADLGTHCSNHMVVVWLQQLEPGWCQLAKKIWRGCPILWGGPRTSRARILFDDPSRSAGSENEARRKGCTVKSAKVESCTQGKGADYFQKWLTISKEWSTA